MITIDEQLKCVEREIGMRKRVYPRWVEGGRMTQVKADSEMKSMEAVADTLRGIQANTRLL
jgi:hypothetical protein